MLLKPMGLNHVSGLGTDYGSCKKTKPKAQKMKSYDSFADWKADQSSSAQTLIQALRKVVNSCDLKLTEAFKWAGGCWVNKDNLPIVYI